MFPRVSSTCVCDWIILHCPVLKWLAIALASAHLMLMYPNYPLALPSVSCREDKTVSN